MPEFTGERLIPGEVEPDLWNEHISRYAFANAVLAPGSRVLDAGCGTGYGTSLLASKGRSVIGLDNSTSAVDYARRHYSSEPIRFISGDAESMPFPAGCFDSVVAFEVIEHMECWRNMLTEARRVLTPSGHLLVSTPNRDWYAEFRADAGPNPFHVHEFNYSEFHQELSAFYSSVRIFGQNHVEAIAITHAGAGGKALSHVTKKEDAGNACFFIAFCGPEGAAEDFVYLPDSGNLLRARANHVRLLERDLEHLKTNHEHLVIRFRGLQSELERSNEWAESLNETISARDREVDRLQRELERSNQWSQSVDSQLNDARAAMAKLERDFDDRTAWASRLDRELSEQRDLHAQTVGLLDNLNEELQQRTEYLHRVTTELTGQLEQKTTELQQKATELEQKTALLSSFDHSRWVRLGRTLHVGPLARR